MKTRGQAGNSILVPLSLPFFPLLASQSCCPSHPPNAPGRSLAWRGHLSWCQPSMLGLHNNSWKGLLKQILPEVPRAATVPAAQEQSYSIPASVWDSIFQSPGPAAAGLLLSPRVRQMECTGVQDSDTKSPKLSRTILDSFSQNYISKERIRISSFLYSS